jgi:hypothetical protein
MGYSGHDFAAAAGGQIGKDEVNDGSANIGKSVAVEEKKRGAAMALSQKLYGFDEGSDFGLDFAPLCCKRCIAL